MAWLANNWIWIALAVAMVAMHTFGHGHGHGHGGHRRGHRHAPGSIGATQTPANETGDPVKAATAVAATSSCWRSSWKGRADSPSRGDIQQGAE
ncbi:MAG: hypothetical protein K2P58_09475 [Hyphomonadaceae bacterium]|nr:hypothetical protein [Hyphomonadaceae bacterium]